jgi:hypothetical protein
MRGSRPIIFSKKATSVRMGSTKKIKKITLQDEIYACTACNYADGFHVSFKKYGKMQTYRAILICPRCSSRFETNWKAVMEPDSGRLLIHQHLFGQGFRTRNAREKKDSNCLPRFAGRPHIRHLCLCSRAASFHFHPRRS